MKACTLLRTAARFDRARRPLEADEIRLTDTKCEAALATACQAREASCDVRANLQDTEREVPSTEVAFAVSSHRPTALGRAGSQGPSSLSLLSKLSMSLWSLAPDVLSSYDTASLIAARSITELASELVSRRGVPRSPRVPSVPAVQRACCSDWSSPSVSGSWQLSRACARARRAPPGRWPFQSPDQD